MKKIYKDKKINIDKKMFNRIRANTKDGKVLCERMHTGEWLTMDQEFKKYNNINDCNFHMFGNKVSIREIEKYLRKHKHYLPKGTVFIVNEIVKIIL